MLTNFLIVDTLRVYNAIIGRPMLNVLRAVASTYCMALKFLTPVEVRVVCGSQVEARRCYTLALKEQPNVHQEANTIESVAHVGLLVTKDSMSNLPNSSTLTSSFNLDRSASPRSGSILVGANLAE